MFQSRLARIALPLAVAATVLSGSALAQGQPTQAEKLLKYRKALYQAIAYNVGSMGAMAQDKAPFNATDFATRAGRVADLAPMLAESYAPETQTVTGSKMKADAWKNRADFDAKLKDFVDSSATLAQVSKGSDAAKTKAAFFDMANTCKACHDKYKED
jgi:cytochrome c556